MKTVLPAICIFLSVALSGFGEAPGATAPAKDKDSESTVDIESLPRQVRQALEKVHVGMTRKEVEKSMRADGGWGYGERYYVPGFVVKSKLVMIKIAFQPAGMPDAIYANGLVRVEWMQNHDLSVRWSDDVVRQIGEPFLSGGAID